MRTIFWLIRALVFFTLFAFALNNQQSASVRWFFGQEWQAPMVFIVLVAFGLGCALGVFAMVPSWWRHRRVARLSTATRNGADDSAAITAAPPPTLEHPPRDGL